MAAVEPGTMNGDVPQFTIGGDESADDAFEPAATLQDEVYLKVCVCGMSLYENAQ